MQSPQEIGGFYDLSVNSSNTSKIKRPAFAFSEQLKTSGFI